MNDPDLEPAGCAGLSPGPKRRSHLYALAPCRPALRSPPQFVWRRAARHNSETRFNTREKLAKRAPAISGAGAAEFAARDRDIDLKQGMPIMKKTLLSALGLAVALAFAVPALGTTEANAAA